jgi:hypothetical protein
MIRRLLTVLVAGAIACAFSIHYVDGQRVVRIRSMDEPKPADQADTAQDPNAVQPIDPTPEERQLIAALIEQLGSDHLVVRDRAMSELASFEARALGQVREGKQHDHDEISNRCWLLEEVILSKEGELFLAARRLGLSIVELNALLANSDVQPLLDILRTRATAGMVSMWARVLTKLSSRPQLFPTAVLCRDIEGHEGYGRALALAAGSEEAAPAARSMQQLLALMPPGDAADTVEALTRLRYAIGGSRGLDNVMGSALDLRGAYTPAELLAARGGRPDVSWKEPDDAAETRAIIALSTIPKLAPGQLAAAALPPWPEMSPAMFNVWLSLLMRSGMHELINTTLDAVLQVDADAQRVTAIAAAWAGVAPVSEVAARFDSLPLSAQLAVLDAWWLQPREPVATQRFLLGLLKGTDATLSESAARVLGQYAAPSTAAALLAQMPRPGSAALEALVRMADVLSPDQLKQLADALPAAVGATRALIVEALVRARHAAGLEPLVAAWRKNLPAADFVLAVRALALSSDTPAGALASAIAAELPSDDWQEFETELDRLRTPGELALLRVLLTLDADTGFALLETMAGDVTEPTRLQAMRALAISGRDGALIDDWLKRMAGEVSDPLAGSIGEAVSLSMTDSAEQFRRNTLQQGAGAPHIHVVRDAVVAGRSRDISRDELIDVLFSTPEGARTHASMWYFATQPLTPRAALNLANAVVFSPQGSSMLFSPGLALMLRDSGVDLLSVMFGETRTGEPRDTTQLFATLLLCDRESATAIVGGLTPKPDGSDFMALMIAKAWLGLLDGDNSRRLKSAVSRTATNAFGTLARIELAGNGDHAALQSLLDAFGYEHRRYQAGSTASVTLNEQRWGSSGIAAQGVASAAFTPHVGGPQLSTAQVGAMFKAPPPADWRSWWAGRRGLLTRDPDSGRYTFTELP